MALWRVFKYTISLSAFRNLFSLNSNPKPDQGWLYFKARYKKTLLERYPSNVKGWKSKFFFISGDKWEFPKRLPREGALRVLRTWGVPDKHCNNPPRLYGDEPRIFEEIFKLVEKLGRFSVQVLLDSKSFCRVFVFLGSMASETAGEERPGGGALSSSSDAGESRPSHEHVQQQSHSRDNSVECLGSIRTELRKILPTRPNPSEVVEGKAMSKRISFKKFGEKLKKSKNGSSSGTPALAKGVVISKKCIREEKGDLFGRRSDHPNHGLVTSWGRYFSQPQHHPGPHGLHLGSPSIAEKLLRGVIPPADKEKLSVDLEQQLDEARVREQQANNKLAKMKSDRDSLANKFERSGVLVVEMREALDKAKESAVEEFKSSSKFLVAVEDSTSKYFGKEFEFCLKFAIPIFTGMTDSVPKTMEYGVYNFYWSLGTEEALSSCDRLFLIVCPWPQLVLLRDIFVDFALEGKQSFRNTFGKGVEQRTRSKSFHHRHDHYLVTGILHFYYGLVKSLYLVFQALGFLLVNGEEVGGILLPVSVAHEVGNEESAEILSWVGNLNLEDIRALNILSVNGDSFYWIPMKMNFLHVWEDSVIKVTPFVLGWYYGFGSDLLSDESGEIAQHWHGRTWGIDRGEELY
ncbi:hypothetical protein Acr_05g0008340 [Actinidia rufa]|uniref:Uncharacterized protein n=1 Tax=Actinidia rufa TaxID=165716 RepID=A0A7J0EL49_9ERIC|nr:hypothetical protein Acr_05g0008340 [Actinidia rufa]